MTKKELIDITRQCFKEYGFKIYKDIFIMSFNDFVLDVRFTKSTFANFYLIDYGICIKKYILKMKY